MCCWIIKNLVIFYPFSRSPQWTDLQEILHRGSSRGHNRLFQILCQSVEGFRICAGSNFAILHWLSRSPLTQGCATARLWLLRCIGTIKKPCLRDLDPWILLHPPPYPDKHIWVRVTHWATLWRHPCLPRDAIFASEPPSFVGLCSLWVWCSLIFSYLP